MITRPTEGEIDPTNPFADDRFGRKDLAIGLVKFLAKTQGPLTIALTSPFGGGKSFFLNRCKHLLKSAEVPVVMLNAWETDFSAEPIAPLIAEFTAAFEDKLPKTGKSLAAIKGIVAKIAAAAVPIGIRALTLGILDLSDVTEAAIGDAAEKAAAQKFEEFASAKGSISFLKTQLTDWADSIRPLVTPRPPVVVIIDELDRCRPSYAIEMLEVIKHLFAIPGIVFVLGIDRAQLSSSARAIFGQGTDADGYLRRFIDLECAMPEPDIARFCQDFGKDFILNVTGINCMGFQGALARASGQLCKDAGFSLRKTQQFLTRFGAAVSQNCDSDDAEMLALMTFLCLHDHALYRRFVTIPGTSASICETICEFSPTFLTTVRGDHFLPFLFSFAVKGNEDSPSPFLRAFRGKLVIDDPRHRQCEVVANQIGDWTKGYIQKLGRNVDFGAAFMA